MPRQTLEARDILDQAGKGKELVLVRDYNRPQDTALNDADIVNLTEGNVFRCASRCESVPKVQPPCAVPPKLAFICDDSWEVTIIATQTEHSLKRLLGLADSVRLFRDLESPNDQLMKPEERIHFADGPVFSARKVELPQNHEIKIIVNGREKSVSGEMISYAAVVALAFNPANPQTIYTVTYAKGTPTKPQGSLVAGDSVKLECGMIFNVTATTKS